MSIFYAIYFLLLTIIAIVEIRYNSMFSKEFDLPFEYEKTIKQRILLGWVVLTFLGMILLVLSFNG